MSTPTTGRVGRGRTVLLMAAAALVSLVLAVSLLLARGNGGETASQDLTESTADQPATTGSGAPAGNTSDELSSIPIDAAESSTGNAQQDGLEANGPDIVEGPSEPMSQATAKATLTNALEGEADRLKDPRESVRVARSVTGNYAEALALRLAEFEDRGWTQEGTPEVVSIEIVEERLDDAPPSAVALACVDSSDVQILDDEGNSLRNAGTPARSANLYTLVREDDVWSITDSTFPDDPNC